MQLESYLPWFRHLLEETIDFKMDLESIQPSNCLGTVLAMNGQRKYYSIYHAHQWSQRKKKRTPYNLAGFMGFGESSDEDSDIDIDPDAQKLFQSDLLNGLDAWLERLCEGTVKRFRIEYWPSLQDKS